MSWNTPAEAKKVWADAASFADPDLQMLLDSAHRDCFVYLDPIDGQDPLDLEVNPTPDASLKASLQLAEIYQARARYQAILSAGEGNAVGVEGMTVTVFPLDWQVKQLLRPTPGRITIG